MVKQLVFALIFAVPLAAQMPPQVTQYGSRVISPVIHWKMVAGSAAQEVYNTAFLSSATNYAPSSDDFTTGWTCAACTGGFEQITFTTTNPSRAYPTLGNGAYGGTTNYTETVEAKIASGTGLFRNCIEDSLGGFHLSSDNTVTTSWQTFTYTFSVNAGTNTANGARPCFYNGSDNAARTVQFRNLRFNLGSSDLGPQYQPDQHAWLGKASLVEASYDPAFTSTGVNFLNAGSGSAYGISIPTKFTLLHGSIYVLYKVNGTPITANNFPLLGASTATSVFVQQNSTNPISGAIISAGYYATGAPIGDGNYHILTIVTDGLYPQIYFDGVPLGPPNVNALSNVSLFNGVALVLGNYGWTNGFPGEIDDVEMFPGVHSPAQVAHFTAAMWTEVSGRGITNPNIYAGNLLTLDGDSITAGYLVNQNQTYEYDAAQTTTPVLPFRALAISGKKCSDLVTDAPTKIDPQLAYGTGKKAVMLYCGTNDILLGYSATTIYNSILQYAADRKAAGWPIVAVGMELPNIPSGAGCTANNVVRNAVNADLIASHPNIDVLVRWDTDPNMGQDADCGNTTYYVSGGEHPTVLGHSTMATYLETALPSMFP